jgi:hypothetical protein
MQIDHTLVYSVLTIIHCEPLIGMMGMFFSLKKSVNAVRTPFV